MKDTYAKLIENAKDKTLPIAHRQKTADTDLINLFTQFSKKSLEGSRIYYLGGNELDTTAYFIADYVKFSVMRQIANSSILEVLLKHRDKYLFEHRHDDESNETVINDMIHGFILAHLDAKLSQALNVAHLCDGNVFDLRKRALKLFDDVKYVESVYLDCE